MAKGLPYPLAVDIASRLFFQEAPDLLDLGPSRLGVEEQVAELARVGLDVDGPFCCPRVAFQDEDLVLWPALLLEGVHDGRAKSGGCVMPQVREEEERRKTDNRIGRFGIRWVWTRCVCALNGWFFWLSARASSVPTHKAS